MMADRGVPLPSEVTHAAVDNIYAKVFARAPQLIPRLVPRSDIHLLCVLEPCSRCVAEPLRSQGLLPTRAFLYHYGLHDVTIEQKHCRKCGAV